MRVLTRHKALKNACVGVFVALAFCVAQAVFRGSV